VRSQHAHADIRGIDAAEALKMPGMRAVLTGEDYRADGLGSLPSLAPYKKRDGSPTYPPLRPAIAIGRAMHVGYPVAVVVADTLDIARDTSASLSITRRGLPWYRRAMRSRRMHRNSTTIVRATRPISTKLATRPRSMRRS
jgi:CO/xanthine dehydrogenase Mo-binding subunit